MKKVYSVLTKEELELLDEVVGFYAEMSYRLSDGKFNKLDTTRIGDAVARLRSGEYIMIENPNEGREI